jgi:putative PIN family toxin of toxin-antitoxin system
MRIVLDTNVLVSALLNPEGAPATVLELVLIGAVELVYDDRILAEYREVLARPKFDIDPEEASGLCDDLALRGIHVVAAGLLSSALAVLMPPPGRFDDPDDTIFVEAALIGEADAIVTGNRKHYACVVRPAVLSPREFLDLFANDAPDDA